MKGTKTADQDVCTNILMDVNSSLRRGVVEISRSLALKLQMADGQRKPQRSCFSLRDGDDSGVPCNYDCSGLLAWNVL